MKWRIALFKMSLKTLYRSYIFTFLSCFTLLFQETDAQISNGNNLFSIDTIHEIRLTFTQPNYWDTLVYRYEKERSEYDHYEDDTARPLLASIKIDGKKMDSVGVKLKSNLSYSIPTNKKPLKIYFNSFVKGRTFDGLLKLNLSNEFPDPSMLRNTVAYKIFRDAGIMAPRTAFAKVYVNNKYKGLYVMIEQVDKAFLARHFKYSGGELIKALAGFLFWFPTDTGSFRASYEIKAKNTPETLERLKEFAKKIYTMPAKDFNDSVYSFFNIDTYISVFAADIIYNNWDSYFYGQNYYLYRDSAENKYFYLPWDYNMSLNNLEQNGSNYPILPDGINDDVFQLPLSSRVVNNEKLKQKYFSELFRINQYMSLDSQQAFINKMHKLIAPALKADSGKVMTNLQYEKSLTQRIAISEFEYEGLISFIRNRHEQVLKMLKEVGYVYEIDKKKE